MSILSYEQIENTAQNVGFSPQGAQTIAAIALAESGGNSQAISPRNMNGSIDYGLVQINSIHFNEGAISQAQALNPVSALSYALKLSKGGTDFTPWTTFNTGAYERYLQSPSPGGDTSVVGTADTTSAGSGLAGINSFLTDKGHEILLFLIAITLLGAGLYFLAK